MKKFVRLKKLDNPKIIKDDLSELNITPDTITKLNNVGFFKITEVLALINDGIGKALLRDTIKNSTQYVELVYVLSHVKVFSPEEIQRLTNGANAV